MPVGLNKRQKQQLAATIAGLPAPIAQLREVILLAAEQDQELLGAGECEPELMDAIVAAGGDSVSTIHSEETADLLGNWLEGLAVKEKPWLAPAWFIEGVLRGISMFGKGGEVATKPPKIRWGLQQVEMEIPPGMKTKVYNCGIELKKRGVQIIVGESTELEWEIRFPKRNAPPLAQWAQVPHLRSEIRWDLSIGCWNVCRTITRHAETSLPVMCQYFLTSSNVKIEASIFSKKTNGSDLLQHESILATIRPKELK
jgi:hypothetical protein